MNSAAESGVTSNSSSLHGHCLEMQCCSAKVTTYCCLQKQLVIFGNWPWELVLDNPESVGCALLNKSAWFRKARGTARFMVTSLKPIVVDSLIVKKLPVFRKCFSWKTVHYIEQSLLCQVADALFKTERSSNCWTNIAVASTAIPCQHPWDWQDTSGKL